MSPAEIKDLYKVLGVSESVTKDEIDKAFRRLAIKYHPDKNKGNKRAEERFKEINEAHQILSDNEKRRQYDFMRKNPYGAMHGFDTEGFGAGPQGFKFNGEDFGNIFGGLGGLGDIFDFFTTSQRKSSRRGMSSPLRGEDVVISATIPFRMAAEGGKHTVTFSRTETCQSCSGTGAERGSKATKCPRCEGTGTILVSQGAFGVSRPCPDCMGTGTRITHPCRECRGKGKVQTPRSITVKIPAGIKDGQKIRLAGEGEAGRNGGPNGDLFIQVNVEHDSVLRREGDIIHSSADIDLATAMLGGKVNVGTLQGTVTLKIPPGTQSGTVFKIKGRGIRFTKGRVGDHYVTVKVRIPKNLNAEQQRLFEAFAASLR